MKYADASKTDSFFPKKIDSVIKFNATRHKMSAFESDTESDDSGRTAKVNFTKYGPRLRFVEKLNRCQLADNIAQKKREAWGLKDLIEQQRKIIHPYSSDEAVDKLMREMARLSMTKEERNEMDENRQMAKEIRESARMALEENRAVYIQLLLESGRRA